MNSPAHKRHSGFTLLELLVAIALMALVALSLYASMYIGVRTKRTCCEAVAPYRSLHGAFEFIRKDLTCALKPQGVLAAQFTGTDQAGTEGQDADALLFYCSTYVPVEEKVACDVVKTEYVLAERYGWDDLALVRRRTTNLLSSSTVEPDEEVICRAVRGFDIKYYDGYDWTDYWDSSAQDNSLPLAVEVTITLADTSSAQASAGNQDGDTMGATMKKAVFLSCAQTTP